MLLNASVKEEAAKLGKNEVDLIEYYKRGEKAYRRALEKASLFLRNHPPGDACEMGNIEILGIVSGGANRDPEGKEWITYFLSQAINELMREEGENDSGK